MRCTQDSGQLVSSAARQQHSQNQPSRHEGTSRLSSSERPSRTPTATRCSACTRRERGGEGRRGESKMGCDLLGNPLSDHDHLPRAEPPGASGAQCRTRSVMHGSQQLDATFTRVVGGTAKEPSGACCTRGSSGSFGTGTDQGDLGFDRVEGSLLRKGRRHVDDGCVRLHGVLRLLDGVEHRKPEVRGAALLRGHTAHHVRAVGDRLLAVEGPLHHSSMLSTGPPTGDQ